MSEYSVNAYFLDKKAIQKAVGSKDVELINKVLEDNSKIVKDFKGRFADKKFTTAIKELINGEMEEDFPFHYSFAAWALVAVIADARPAKAFIGYPFVSLYDWIETLENTPYDKLRSVFEGLNGMNSDFQLPISLSDWAEIPCIVFLEEVEETLLAEATQMKQDMAEDAEWLLDFDDDIEDIEQILDWIIEAYQRKRSICLVMEGDL